MVFLRPRNSGCSGTPAAFSDAEMAPVAEVRTTRWSCFPRAGHDLKGHDISYDMSAPLEVGTNPATAGQFAELDVHRAEIFRVAQIVATWQLLGRELAPLAWCRHGILKPHRPHTSECSGKPTEPPRPQIAERRNFEISQAARSLRGARGPRVWHLTPVSQLMFGTPSVPPFEVLRAVLVRSRRLREFVLPSLKSNIEF